MSKQTTRILAVLAGALAVVSAGCGQQHAPASTPAESMSGCWVQSQDGSVIAESEVDQQCLDTARLILPAQEGGTYKNLRSLATRGPSVCTFTPPSGPNTWDVWTAPGAAPDEADALCQSLENESPQGTLNWESGSGYTGEDGYAAASKATAADIYGDGENGSTGNAAWCSNNDPAPGGDDNGPTSLGETVPTTPWYQGCMSELEANPPKPAPVSTSSPDYQAGYSAGEHANTTDLSIHGAEGDCELSAPYGTDGSKQDPDSAFVQGCVAAIKARGLAGLGT